MNEWMMKSTTTATFQVYGPHISGNILDTNVQHETNLPTCTFHLGLWQFCKIQGVSHYNHQQTWSASLYNSSHFNFITAMIHQA
jgi:hypothetical protein